MITTYWKVICSYGFGLEDIKIINKSRCLSICWKLIAIYNQCSPMLINRHFRHKKPIMRRIYSSIGHDMKHSLSFLDEHSRWYVSNGKHTNLWIDDNYLSPYDFIEH